MIMNRMKPYDYLKIKVNEQYGQEVIPQKDATPEGQVKLSIFPSSRGTQENLLYADCAYVGFTYDNEIDDKYIIQYGKERLKVMYVQPHRLIKQVYFKRVN